MGSVANGWNLPPLDEMTRRDVNHLISALALDAHDLPRRDERRDLLTTGMYAAMVTMRVREPREWGQYHGGRNDRPATPVGGRPLPRTLRPPDAGRDADQSIR